jgi:hypothetical protein
MPEENGSSRAFLLALLKTTFALPWRANHSQDAVAGWRGIESGHTRTEASIRHISNFRLRLFSLRLTLLLVKPQKSGPPSGPAPVSRRDFLTRTAAGVTALGALPALSSRLFAAAAGSAEPNRIGNPRWFEHAWRRAVIDMHIPDWDEKFLSQFDAGEYVQRLVTSRAQSIVCYAQSHVGLFNYPTKIGQPHRGLKGRDIVAEMIEGCHRENIAVVLYVSLIHDRWASDQHANWRIVNAAGQPIGPGSRHGFVCPNSPYREYVRAWVGELCERFDFEGLRFDMTFWPAVCYCAHCRKRWADEVGGEMPATINWFDERWVTLARKRETWLGDFAAVCTHTVKQLKPGATVEHQSSTYPRSWGLGASWPLVAENDFLQGDFYGDALQGSFVRKMLEELTPRRPFGYETSFSVELRDHTGKKSELLLEAKASAAIADAAAFIFIDAIDPVGTVNPHAHQRMGRVFDRLKPFYAHLGGERVADVAVYYSLDSRIDMKQNGKPVLQADTAADTHTASSMLAARWLMAEHLPFGVITKKSLATKLSRTRVVVLSNVHFMDAGEAAAIRDWVRAGGTLYASGGTSLVNEHGQLQPDFLLADVFGVSIAKPDWTEREHYIAPTPAGREQFPGWDAKYPAYVRGAGMEVRALAGATMLATTTLPWPASDPREFSSIHSNPPWIPTKQPEVVLNQFGKGRAIYCASQLETVEGLAPAFIKLIRLLHAEYTFEIAAHPAVEATLFHQPDRRRYLLSLVNFQKDLPNIPVEGIEVKLRLATKLKSVTLLPDGKALKFRERSGVAAFTAPRLDTLLMCAVNVA